MSVIEDFKRYTFDGLVSTQPFRNLNSVGSTGEALALLHLLGAQDDAYTNSLIKGLDSCRIDAGLYDREPNIIAPRNKDCQAQDDYFGILVAAAVVPGQQWRALEIVERGRESGWTYVNEYNFVCIIKCGLIRFPALICNMHFAAGIRPTAFLRACWQIYMATGTWSDPSVRQDGFRQRWDSAMIYKFAPEHCKSDGCNRVYFGWWEFMERKGYKMADIMAKYTGLPDHPFSKYWPSAR